MKTIKKQICVLFCILSLFACSKEESNPQYDPSNVLFKDIPVSAIKKMCHRPLDSIPSIWRSCRNNRAQRYL